VDGSPSHGVDWILSDDTGHVFIEAKTKRLTIAARSASNTEALGKDLQVMADAIVQNYRNILDAKAGRTDWMPDDRPIYPLIATLEDWFIVSPNVKALLDDRVQAGLIARGMDIRLQERGTLRQILSSLTNAHCPSVL
jgi:hypothetical protein